MLDISQRTLESSSMNDSELTMAIMASTNDRDNIRTTTTITTAKTSEAIAVKTNHDVAKILQNVGAIIKEYTVTSTTAQTATTAPEMTSPATIPTLPFLAWSPSLMQDNGNSTTVLNTSPTQSLIYPPENISSSNNFTLFNETSFPSSPPPPLPIDDDNEVLRTFEYIGALLNFYYVPILVCTGSLGNILSVLVFFKTKLRKLSSSIYLGALAVSDTCFLLGLFAQWLNFVDIHIYNREYFCQFFTFFSSLASFCSNWFVVAFTVERFIAVMYPLKRQTMCTVRRAKMVLLGLTLLGCMHCAPFLMSSRVVYSPKAEMTLCDIKSEYKDYITILNYWDTVVVFAIPFTTIAVLNTFTGCTVWKFATVRRTLTMQKMKNHNLHQHHETIVSTPLISQCDNMTTNLGAPTKTTTTTTAAVSLGATTMTTRIDEHQVMQQLSQQHQNTLTTYRLGSGSTATTTSLKRSNKLHCCCAAAAAAAAAATNTQLNGHENIAHSEPQNFSNSQRSSIKSHQKFSRHHQHSFNCNHSHHHHHHQQQQQQQQSQRNFATRNCCNGSICTDLSRKSGRRKSVNSSQLKVTKMLLIVSTVFVCLNLPSFIMRIITFLETQASTNAKTTIVLQYIFQLFFITNFGINFVLYCVSGQNFRKAFLSIFRRVPNTQREITTQVTSKYVSEFFCNNSCGQQINGTTGVGGTTSGGSSTVSFNRNLSARRRMVMTENSWNELHEMQCKK